MKIKDIDANELQIILDGFSQTLSEIKDEVSEIKKNIFGSGSTNNPESALTVDLLNKVLAIIEQAKKCITAEELKQYSTEMVNTMCRLQKESSESFARFLNEKIEELNQIAEQPSIVENRYTIDFKSSSAFIAIVVIFMLLLCSLFGNYNQYQNKKVYAANDLKYRYIKMVNGIDPQTLNRLENIFDSPDSIRIVRNIEVHVADYERRLKEKIRKEEQKRKLEKEIDNLRIE